MIRKFRDECSWKRAAVTLGCSLVLAFGLAFVKAETLVETDESRAAETWVEGHLSTLPGELNQLAAYPKPYRSHIFNRLSAETKLKMVKQHVADLLASSIVSLSAEQRAHLVASVDRLKVQQIQNPGAAPRPDAICAATKVLFPEAKDRRLVGMASLGDYTTPVRTWASNVVGLREAVRSITLATLRSAVTAEEEEEFPTCKCYSNLCDCFSMQFCRQNNNWSGWMCKPSGKTNDCVDWWDSECIWGDYVACTGKCLWLWEGES